MGKFEESFYRNFGSSFTQKLLFVIFMAAFLPIIGIGLYFVVKNPDSKLANASFGLPLLIAFVSSWYFSERTAHFMIDENIGFKNAFLHSILPCLNIVHYLPIIGSLINKLNDRKVTSGTNSTSADTE